MYYYQRLRDLREDHDLTQTDIARYLGMARGQYQRYESGKQELPVHHFMRLAVFYNISLDYLTGIIESPVVLDAKRRVNLATKKPKIKKVTITWSQGGLELEEN